MRLYHLIAIIALIAGGYDPTLSATALAAAPPAANPTPEQTNSTLLIGTWEEDSVRIELRADGSYECWAPYLQSDLAAKTMLQSGTWSVREQTLLLHSEKAFLPNADTGVVITNDIVSVSSKEALLVLRIDGRKVKWTKVSPQDEPFWKGAVSYEPPFKMHSQIYPTNAEPSAGDWELSSWQQEAGTNSDGRVVFHLGTVAEFIGNDRPAKPLETVADLKAFMDAELKTNPPGGSALISIGNISGREALMSITPTNRVPGEPIKWCGGACFFWEVKPVWQNSTICSITITAETRETFNLLANSLKTIKLLGGKQKN